MVLKERINWHKLCFRVITPMIIFHEGLLLLFFHSSLSLFIFIDSLFFFFGSFFQHFLVLLFLISVFFLHGVNSTLLELYFSHRLSTSSIWIIHDLREIFLAFAPQCGGWSLVRVDKETIRLKRETNG